MLRYVSPVIEAILEQHPNVEITFLTRPFFKPLFKSNSRLSFHFADFKKNTKDFLVYENYTKN
jgi:ADP-heptose:LPS heptosyltransferase